MELAKLFKPLMELEYQMHRMYMWFGDVFEQEPGAQSLFRLMAREELQHRDNVKNQYYLVIKSIHQYAPVAMDVSGLIQFTGMLKERVDGRQPMVLRDALTTAVQVEKSAAESHYRFLIAISNPVLKELIVELARADREHLNRLERFLAVHS